MGKNCCFLRLRIARCLFASVVNKSSVMNIKSSVDFITDLLLKMPKLETFGFAISFSIPELCPLRI